LYYLVIVLQLPRLIFKVCPLPIQGLGASWEVEGQGWGEKFNNFFIPHLLNSLIKVYTSPLIPLLEGRGKIILF
jgi:hypothetical protein